MHDSKLMELSEGDMVADDKLTEPVEPLPVEVMPADPSAYGVTAVTSDDLQSLEARLQEQLLRYKPLADAVNALIDYLSRINSRHATELQQWKLK